MTVEDCGSRAGEHKNKALSLHFGAKIRLIKLRTGHGRPFYSTTCRAQAPRHNQGLRFRGAPFGRETRPPTRRLGSPMELWTAPLVILIVMASFRVLLAHSLFGAPCSHALARTFSRERATQSPSTLSRLEAVGWPALGEFYRRQATGAASTGPDSVRCRRSEVGRNRPRKAPPELDEHRHQPTRRFRTLRSGPGPAEPCQAGSGPQSVGSTERHGVPARHPPVRARSRALRGNSESQLRSDPKPSTFGRCVSSSENQARGTAARNCCVDTME